MLQLNSISLVQFKNYNRFHLDITHKRVCITGNNGVGKTNLLDAIYYLCFTRSYFNTQDTQNVTHGRNGFRIAGNFLRKEQIQEVVCTFRLPIPGEKPSRKEFMLNKEPYSRFSKHLGFLPCVVVTPDDSVLINGGSEQRRRFIDTILAQTDAAYLDNLIAYQKILQQRNALLKNTEHGNPDDALLSILDSQLCRHGNLIYGKRKAFMPTLIRHTALFYREIAQVAEEIDLEYRTTLHGISMEDILLRNRHRDRLMQRTSDGIHRDDLVFTLNGHPLKQSASQGQRKNFLFALKLAQYQIVKEAKGLAPFLLLDDIFEKLDHRRIAHLVHLISNPDFGQVFITDTEENRLRTAFAGRDGQVQMIGL